MKPQADQADETAPALSTTPTLDELLELAARSQAAHVGPGTLVGECLDTHHPHLPGRVFVRVRDREGVPVMAWLPTLELLRVRAGDRVLLTKPDNWPEPVVMGVVAGLAELDREATRTPAPASAAGADAGDAQLQLEPGQGLTVRGPSGAALLRITSTTHGPKLTLFEDRLDLELTGRLRLGAEQIELHAGAGGVDIRTEGDAVVRARFIRLN